MQAWGQFSVYNHIGVGSGVVCSTISGNAKASVRGTDSKMVPRLFLSINKYVKYDEGYT